MNDILIAKGSIWPWLIVLLGMTIASCNSTDCGRMPAEAMSLETLADFCRLSAPCGTTPAWDGKMVTIWGYVDPANVFDKQHYPRLPYEKFKLIDHRSHSVEVWPKGSDNTFIFSKLAQRPSDKAVVSGRLEAVLMPTKSSCTYGVRVMIDDATQIHFE